MDHVPHPLFLLTSLRSLYGDRALPDLYFHVYGDFTRFTRDWLSVEPVLSGTRTRFLCASPAQTALVERFLKPAPGIACTIPFPVDPETYGFSAGERRRWRTRLGIGTGDLLIGYTGRISDQKNSYRMLQEALRFRRVSGTSVRLIAAGTFDELGVSFFGARARRGTARQKWNRLVRESERGAVRHLGALGPRELRGFYNAMDVFFSLSLYHDEDFGMAPAEALSCGVPAVLTAWGGYAGFRGPGCHLVPVRLSREGFLLSSAGIQTALGAAVEECRDLARREERAEHFQSRFSVGAVSSSLRTLLGSRPPRFSGFTRLLRAHTEALSTPPLFPRGPRPFGLYPAIYRSYWRRGRSASRVAESSTSKFPS